MAHIEDGNRIPLVEALAVQEIFITGIVPAEEISPNLFRVIAYSEQRSLIDGSMERVVVARFIASGETLATMGELLARGREISPLLHMVKPEALAN